MAVISLRNYTRNIEILIDQGKFPDAVKHCKHVLKFHPKHIETYRLLGKAYLENQQYSESADIFLRILSVIPDDFVSQIGMSIIREDEGNLDAAIWHIERAFEVNPSNAAIQDEIRRLYGSRDGIHLSKIRLTRGALIRMYLQGEMYDQAITEARAALAEDPQRVDLEVLLARLYYQAGKKVEAAETCAQLVNKLPYCLEANKIFSIILTSMNRDEEAKVFQKRINALDPYAAHINKNTPSIQQVPDNAVLLEEMDLDSEDEEQSSQPEWAQTIGVKMDTQDENALPDWLPSLTEEEDVISGSKEEISPAQDEELEVTGLDHLSLVKEDEIPDWMKTAGWQQPSGPGEKEPELEPMDESTEELLDEIEQTEIPDWLKDLAPPGEAKKPEFTSFTTPETPASDIPTPMDKIEEQPEEAQTLEEFAEFDEAIDWLDSIASTSETDQDPMESDPERMQGLPDEWVREYQEGMEEPPQESIETAETETEKTSIAQGDLKAVKDLPEMADEETSQSTEPLDESGELDQEDFEDTFAWLESLAAKQGADESTLSTTAEQREQEIPAWISELKTGDEQVKEIFSDSGDQPAVQTEDLAETERGEHSSFKEHEEIQETGEIDTSGDSDFETLAQAEDQPVLEMEEFSGSEVGEWETLEKIPPLQEESTVVTEKGEETPTTDEDFMDISLPEDETSAPEEEESSAPGSELNAALKDLQTGEIERAVNKMNELITHSDDLLPIITGLEKSLEDHPIDARIWQCLGDAYAQNNQFQNALEAYSKAEEVLQ